MAGGDKDFVRNVFRRDVSRAIHVTLGGRICDVQIAGARLSGRAPLAAVARSPALAKEVP